MAQPAAPGAAVDTLRSLCGALCHPPIRTPSHHLPNANTRTHTSTLTPTVPLSCLAVAATAVPHLPTCSASCFRHRQSPTQAGPTATAASLKYLCMKTLCSYLTRPVSPSIPPSHASLPAPPPSRCTATRKLQAFHCLSQTLYVSLRPSVPHLLRMLTVELKMDPAVAAQHMSTVNSMMAFMLPGFVPEWRAGSQVRLASRPTPGPRRRCGANKRMTASVWCGSPGAAMMSRCCARAWQRCGIAQAAHGPLGPMWSLRVL
eukprot:365061-Chlamydomonas_euryale.AAC.11